MAKGPQLIVGSLSRASTRGWVDAHGLRFPCAIGRTGIRAIKREGDGATPHGRFRLLRVLYRADRVHRPRTMLPVRRIGPTDGWCDSAGDRNYNQPVRLPYSESAESLWRDDRLYDLVVVLDHNTRPRRQGAGSAIFMHVARPGYLPTEGCVALSARHLETLLARLRRGARISVT